MKVKCYTCWLRNLLGLVTWLLWIQLIPKKKLDCLMYFSEKEKRGSRNWWKTCGMRDSREKGSGMRDQDPSPSRPCPNFCISLQHLCSTVSVQTKPFIKINIWCKYIPHKWIVLLPRADWLAWRWLALKVLFTSEHWAVNETLKINHFSVNCYRYSGFWGFLFNLCGIY